MVTPNPAQALPQPARTQPSWLLGIVSIWLWLFAIFVWEIDAPSAEFVTQNLKATHTAFGMSLLAKSQWIAGFSIVLAALLVWRRRFAAAWAVPAIGVPATLLTLWYITEEMPTRTAIMHMLSQPRALEQGEAPAERPAAQAQR